MEMVDLIKKMLLSDWNDVNFVIGSNILKIKISSIANPSDMIEIKFDLTSLDSLQGLHAYMTTLINSNSEVLRFCLRKVTGFWGHKENGFIYYMVAPPWVKLYVVSSFFINMCFRMML